MHHVATAQDVAGRAFCFLPLPGETGLPVHANAFFELSSNRRDLWFGHDLAGAGQLRASWNERLVREVVAPLYVEALELQAQRWGADRDAWFRWEGVWRRWHPLTGVTAGGWPAAWHWSSHVGVRQPCGVVAMRDRDRHLPV